MTLREKRQSRKLMTTESMSKCNAMPAMACHVPECMLWPPAAVGKSPNYLLIDSAVREGAVVSVKSVCCICSECTQCGVTVFSLQN